MSVPKLRFPEFRGAGKWNRSTLGSIATITSGGTPSRAKQEYWNGNIPWITTSLIDFNIIQSANEFISAIGLKESSAKIFPKNTILMAMYGQGITRGKVAVLGIDAATNQACAAILLKKGLNSSFVFQNLASRYDEIRDLSNQGGQENLSGGLIAKISFSFPNSNSEQQKIADCLTSIDALINAQSQKIETLKTHKKSLMRQLFPHERKTIPRLRFHAFRDAGAWNMLRFGEIAKFLSGGTPSKDIAEYWNGDIPWISASSMHSTKIEISDSNITELAVSAGARIAKKGTLLLLVRGSMLHKRIPMGIAAVTVAFNQDVKAINLNADITEQFLMFFLMACEAKLLQAVTATGIGAGKLDTNDLNDFPVCAPLPQEQQKIANCLTSIDVLINVQTQKLEALKTHKKGLMQALFPAPDEVEA